MSTNGRLDLVLNQLVLLPGAEWRPNLPGWGLIRVSRGLGYWVQRGGHADLSCGSALILSERAQGVIRCSQLCEMILYYFFVQPEKLSGILTPTEQQILD